MGLPGSATSSATTGASSAGAAASSTTASVAGASTAGSSTAAASLADGGRTRVRSRPDSDARLGKLTGLGLLLLGLTGEEVLEPGRSVVSRCARAMYRRAAGAHFSTKPGPLALASLVLGLTAPSATGSSTAAACGGRARKNQRGFLAGRGAGRTVFVPPRRRAQRSPQPARRSPVYKRK